MDTVDRIFELLDSTTMEQQEFARLVGVSDDTASDWRRRRSASYTKRLTQIASVLGTTVDYLLTGKKEKPIPDAGNGQISPARQALLDAVSDMDEDTARAVLDLIRSVKQLRGE